MQLKLIMVIDPQGKIRHSFITQAKTCQEAEIKFKAMIYDELRKGGADEWHPLPTDIISVEPFVFDAPVTMIL